MATKFETIEWALNANIYEVNVRQYTEEGTFIAFESHLLRLREMGVEILWFMPITPISKLNRKGSLGSYYACSNYTAINPEFGTLDDFKNLVTAAHQLGFKVIIDWVANHTGCDHVWTKQHPDFYKKNERGEFYDAYGWEDVIDLDYNNNELQKEMISAMDYWVKECDIDGFRCDMANLVPLNFWFDARKQLDTKKKLFWLAECEEASYHEVFDATYGWELLHAMEDFAQNKSSMQTLISLLNKSVVQFPSGALRLFFTSNHDENTHSGSEYERLGKSSEAFAVLCATWQSSLPLIYSGQELPNKKRLPFFEKDEIEWKNELEFATFYKTILSLRKINSALKAGDEGVRIKMIDTTAPGSILSFFRENGKDVVIVVLNLSNNEVVFSFVERFVSGNFIEAFLNADVSLNATKVFKIDRWGYKIFTGVSS
jgi:glycosidase